jgi:type II secretory pathway component PulF
VIVVPAQLTQRSEFYFQLGQLTAAGLGLVKALQQLQRHPPASAYREPIGQVLGWLDQGYTFSQAVAKRGRWLPAFDVTLIAAGEKSGRLDQSFRLLADYYSDRARITKQMLADLAYPVFLVHFFAAIMPFPQLFLTGNWSAYLAAVLGLLVPLYALVGITIFATQGSHGEFCRAGIEALLHRIPVLGTARHYLALGRLATALEALLSAGVTILEAWDLAAAASGSPALRRIVAGWKPSLLAGQTPAEAVSGSSRFPGLFANQYASGEISGTLDETLRRLHQYYQDEGMRKLRTVARWVPILIYLIIVVVIARSILRFYLGYFQNLRDAGGF